MPISTFSETIRRNNRYQKTVFYVYSIIMCLNLYIIFRKVAVNDWTTVWFRQFGSSGTKTSWLHPVNPFTNTDIFYIQSNGIFGSSTLYWDIISYRVTFRLMMFENINHRHISSSRANYCRWQICFRGVDLSGPHRKFFFTFSVLHLPFCPYRQLLLIGPSIIGLWCWRIYIIRLIRITSSWWSRLRLVVLLLRSDRL